MTPHTRDVLRCAVCGLGVMGMNHLRVLRQIPDVEIVGVVDLDPARRAAVVAAGHDVATFASFGELLTALPIDFVAIATPAVTLPDVAAEAIEAGVPLLIEKPLAPTEETAREMLRRALSAGVTAGVGYVERFNPAVIELKRKLDGGAIGRVYQMQARRLSPFPDRGSMLGASLDLATHDIDVMRHLTGSEITSVYAETQRRLHDRAEDLLCAILRFEDDVTGLLEVNWLTPAKVRSLGVTGEAGMLVVDYISQELYLYEHPHAETTHWSVLAEMRGRGEGNMIRFALQRREPLLLQWEAFLQSVRTGRPPPVELADGLAAVSVARAIQRSGETDAAAVPTYKDDVWWRQSRARNAS